MSSYLLRGKTKDEFGFWFRTIVPIDAESDAEAIEKAKKKELVEKTLFKAMDCDVNVNEQAEAAVTRLERFAQMLEREGILIPQTNGLKCPCFHFATHPEDMHEVSVRVYCDEKLDENLRCPKHGDLTEEEKARLRDNARD